MTEPLVKPDPVTVSVNDPLPAEALFGERLFNIGAGFVELILNVSGALVPPPGVPVKTVTDADPADRISDEGTEADN